jgi:hypothetical protein
MPSGFASNLIVDWWAGGVPDLALPPVVICSVGLARLSVYTCSPTPWAVLGLFALLVVAFVCRVRLGWSLVGVALFSFVAVFDFDSSMTFRIVVLSLTLLPPFLWL